MRQLKTLVFIVGLIFSSFSFAANKDFEIARRFLESLRKMIIRDISKST